MLWTQKKLWEGVGDSFPSQACASAAISEGERGGSEVECRTPEREVRGSKPIAAVLCPWARHFTPRKYWLITQEAMAPSRHDWKIVDWDVKPQHNQPTAISEWSLGLKSTAFTNFKLWKIFWLGKIDLFSHLCWLRYSNWIIEYFKCSFFLYMLQHPLTRITCRWIASYCHGTKV